MKAMSPSAVTQESEAVSQMVAKDAKYLSATTVALYSSMQNEFDTTALLQDAFAKNKRVFMPRVIDKERHEMKMLECFSTEEIKRWQQSSWGIHEPPLDGRAETPSTVELDVLIMPGVAFTLSGARCGQGMGFYDTFLANYARQTGKKPYLVAPVLSAQVVPDVPMSEHDQPVDRVVSVQSSA